MSQVDFHLVDTLKGNPSFSIHNSTYIFRYPCSSKKDCTPYHFTLGCGVYKIEAWGARGGTDYFGGGYALGAYVSGYLDLKTRTSFYGYIGGMGSIGVPNLEGVAFGGYNGGGDGMSWGSSGGGGTDIRLTSSIFSRIFVAGAAGGGERTSNGHGGGLTGIQGQYSNCNGFHISTGSTPGNQTSGGIGGTSTYGDALPGSLGQGGNGYASEGGGGGGGGYYGGGGTPYVCAASGGSSYISGHPGCHSITQNGEASSSTIHYSHIYFTNTVMIDGNQPMPLPDIESFGIGNAGDGAIRITYLFKNNISCYFDRHLQILFILVPFFLLINHPAIFWKF